LVYSQANADVKEIREEREESLALMQATSWHACIDNGGSIR
jgi:hypothetical protein